MFIARLLIRLWLVGVHLGLWGDRSQLLHGAHSRITLDVSAGAAHGATAAPAPLVGVAARQGRRFSMEDRWSHEAGSLPATRRGCGAANYTFLAGAAAAVGVCLRAGVTRAGVARSSVLSDACQQGAAASIRLQRTCSSHGPTTRACWEPR
jgi:hypothetical protein